MSTPHYYRLLPALLCLGWATGSFGETPDNQTDQTGQQFERFRACRTTIAALERLDCYDRAWLDGGPVAISQATGNIAARSRAWQRAFELEKQREGHTTGFMRSIGEGDQPDVLLTTPALGQLPPRPTLIFSCIDNITRMQVALLQPVQGELEPLTLKTDGTAFTSTWFAREGGYLIDANRGLPGIEDIKRLFNSKQLTLSSSNPAVRTLTFNIDNLAEQIKPLRTACHW